MLEFVRSSWQILYAGPLGSPTLIRIQFGQYFAKLINAFIRVITPFALSKRPTCKTVKDLSYLSCVSGLK